MTAKCPGSAPELNPDESVWGQTKDGWMMNFAPEDTAGLRSVLLEELGLEMYEQPLIQQIEAQNAEIEEMIETGQMSPVIPRVDNHLIQYYVVRNF